jgi:nucleoside-diphosphate-sugar epimerase
MKALFIGGTGIISTAVTKKIAENPKWELYLLNRGKSKAEIPENVKTITCDINDAGEVKRKIDGMTFDVTADFISFTKTETERNYNLLKGKTNQYIFISSASAYNKNTFPVNESTHLHNPYWDYSRKKAECEDYLTQLHKNEGFPVTIVRPSHTYSKKKLPVGLHGGKGSWVILQRMLKGKEIIIHGDGTSLWTLTHANDFAKAFAGLMANPHTIGEAYHITSDEALSWNRIYAEIAKAYGKELKPFYVSSDFLSETGRYYNYDFTGALLGDKANTAVFDNTKIKRAVPGFTAETRFDEGVRESVAYLLEHKELQTDDPQFDGWCDKVIEVQKEAKRKMQNYADSILPAH